MRVAETGGRIGFITPMTNNFCASCNRVRLTATGELVLCLGRDERVDLRGPMRGGASDAEIDALIVAAIARKPEKHDFRIGPGQRPGAGAADVEDRRMSLVPGGRIDPARAVTPVRIAVLTVSDTRDAASDTSGAYPGRAHHRRGARACRPRDRARRGRRDPRAGSGVDRGGRWPTSS